MFSFYVFIIDRIVTHIITYMLCQPTQGRGDLRAICENLLTRCFESKDNSTVILVQFKPAARIPPPASAAAAPVVHPTAAGISSTANPDASAEVKAGSSSGIKAVEDEEALLASVNNA